jgi:hypothetical protein
MVEGKEQAKRREINHFYNGKNTAHATHWMRQLTQRFDFHTNTLTA